VMWSHDNKQGLLRHMPQALLADSFGSSEAVGLGISVSAAGQAEETARFMITENNAVFTDDGRRVEPGSGEMGMVAVGGFIPVGYYKDEAKTKATFVEADGVRWVLPGDMATVDDDGTVVLLGRGSGSINTGGEKVFPEEVEAVLKGHPAIYDALVVGVPDDRWGERVAAVVQSRPGADVTLDDLQAHARSELAGYKVPRDVVLVDEIRRGPNGKPDYAWAKEHARAELTSSSRSPRRPG
jgi:acyl-CoA synthetase (AMP-forming)/AMP-acid ligase II